MNTSQPEIDVVKVWHFNLTAVKGRAGRGIVCVRDGACLRCNSSSSPYLTLPVIVGKNAAPLLYLFSFVSGVWPVHYATASHDSQASQVSPFQIAVLIL